MSQRPFCERFLALLSVGDFESMGAMVDPDFTVHEAAGLPYGGTYHGIEGWRTLAKAVVTSWAGFKLHPPEFVGESDDMMVLRFMISGRSRKTSTPFESSVMELWRFRAGKLHEIFPYYWDTHLLATIAG